MMKLIASLCILAVIFLGQASLSQQGVPPAKGVKEYLANLPFPMPELRDPVFPDRRVNVVEHGAVADGRTLNTKAFAGAIHSCSSAGGGTVVVGPGTWLTGPIRLESNVRLHLERGAVVQFSGRYEDFPLIPGFDGKSKKYIITPPVSAYRAENIAITGAGVIDGSGEAWRYVKKEKLTSRQWQDLTRSGGAVSPDGKEWWPSREAMGGGQYLDSLEKTRALTAEDFAHTREFLRPDLVRLVQCTGILLDGPTFQNSPRFHVYLVQSENIIVRNVSIRSEWYAQNGDGLDLNACRNVVVYNVTVDVGDDGICLKPGRVSERQKPGPACENIVIADCIVYHAHGGFVIGSESLGGAKNISVKNCTFAGTDVGIRFKSLRGKGGPVGNIFIDGIQMSRIANEAILFDMFYGGDSPEIEALKNREEQHSEPVTELTPKFRDIFIKNVVCSGATRSVLIDGLPEMPVRNVHIEDARITAEKGILCINADSLFVHNAGIFPAGGPVVTLVQSTNVDLLDVAYPPGSPSFLRVDGDATKNVSLKEVDLKLAKKGIEYGVNVHPDAVKHD
jgi:polygalacturonase